MTPVINNTTMGADRGAPQPSPTAMQSQRPVGPAAAAAAKKARDELETADAPVADPVPAAGDRKPTMVAEHLVAANEDYHNKLVERDQIIERLEAELRVKTTAIDDANTINANLQKEAKQYELELKESRGMYKILRENVNAKKAGESEAYKALDKKYNSTKLCFDDAQNALDKQNRELEALRKEKEDMEQAMRGVHEEHTALIQQLHNAQAMERECQEARDFANSIGREFEMVFSEMGRELNAATVLSHIQELQTAASQPQRKANRKVSIADELADHSDAESIAESYHSDDEHPPKQSAAVEANSSPVYDKFDDPFDSMTEEEIAEAERELEAETEAEELAAAAAAAAATPSPRTVANNAKVAEILTEYRPAGESTSLDVPVPKVNFEEELSKALERSQQVEAALAIKTARIEELEAAAAALATKAARVEELEAAEKERIAKDSRTTQQIVTLEKSNEKLQDRIDERPYLTAENTLLKEKYSEAYGECTALIKAKDAEHSIRTKAKDAQIAAWQECINEAQSNSLLIGPLELNPVYIDVVREKTTLEWFRDAPFWWQFLLSLMLLFLCMGNLSVWIERNAWVSSNVFAMDHIRAMAKQGIRGPSAATLWFEEMIGFERTSLG